MDKLRSQFIHKVESGDYLWRILRLTTFLDLILIELSKTQKNFEAIFDLCIKSLIVNDLGEIGTQRFSYGEIIRIIENEKVEIFKLFDEQILVLNERSKENFDSISNIGNYLNTVVELNLDKSFPREFIIRLMTSVYQKIA